MPDKVAAWMRQSEHDLEHARVALAAGICDWACHAAGAAAEKAVKAVLLAQGGKVLGNHNLLLLFDRMRHEAGLTVSEGLVEDARDLMQVLGILSGQCTYNGVAPFELISRAQAEGAIAAAERIRAGMRAHTAVAGPSEAA
ncbi:MAG TPA: HEPN domain-containing protein [Azospirillum sp.]|nr:HEPN domain-containing protein [Azospirillum sp.]